MSFAWPLLGKLLDKGPPPASVSSSVIAKAIEKVEGYLEYQDLMSDALNVIRHLTYPLMLRICPHSVSLSRLRLRYTMLMLVSPRFPAQLSRKGTL